MLGNIGLDFNRICLLMDLNYDTTLISNDQS